MSPSFTKSGPGRRMYSAKERAKHLTTIKQKQAGQFGKALTAAFAAVRAEKLSQSWGRKDGDYTLTGRGPGAYAEYDDSGALVTGGRVMASGGGLVRRMWLAGISAQRGY